MDVKHDLIGKTITGVIASVPDRTAPREIWMLQFSDGTHVEFVSPSAKRALKRSVRSRRVASRQDENAGQLTLNVA